MAAPPASHHVPRDREGLEAMRNIVRLGRRSVINLPHTSCGRSKAVGMSLLRCMSGGNT